MNLAMWLLSGITISIIVTQYAEHFVKGGRVGTIALGVFGAMQGGFIANLSMQSSFIHFDMASLIIAVSGSICLLALGKVFSYDIGSRR